MRSYLVLLSLCLLAACAAPRHSQRYFRKNLKAGVETSPVFGRAFTGFHLIDAATGRELCAVNADRYFTPASNTKILTLATCLRVLGDSIPGIRWVESGQPGVKYFKGAGDPTFLNPDFNAWQTIFTRLKADSSFWYGMVMPSAPDPRLGRGWAWDDAGFDYSAERSCFPIYGGLIRVKAVTPDSLDVQPPIWRSAMLDSATNGLPYYDHIPIRAPFKKPYTPGMEWSTPLPLAGSMAPVLLLDTLEEGSNLWYEYTGVPEQRAPAGAWHTLYSTPVDTVYRRMMHQSDNFIAEQLLMVCAGEKFDTLRQEKIIAWAKDSLFAGLPDPPRWVDGSGLSRYNLISPRFLTALLRQLYLQQNHERLFALLPAGGISGTIEDWYRGPDGRPFVFAKTGSMSGVHCLSGYLVAKSGHVLIFSFMHNNFIGSNKPWKSEMQRLLLEIRQRG